MKKILICLLLCSGFAGSAQVYNNEWIDYDKTYYKFKVGKTGLHRIPQSVLAAAGLANTPVEQLQLFRNGAEVPIYTTVAAGLLPANAFIEFWGERNDGKGDKALYRKPEYQLNDRQSLQTDTAAYFLTVNTSGGNKRLVDVNNAVAGNTLSPEPYFLHTHNQSFNDQINGGYAVDVTQYLYSSAYDIGEGYSSYFIGTNGTHSLNLGNLYVAGSGPAAKFKIVVAGNRITLRRYRVKINSDSIAGNEVNFFNAAIDSATVPLSVISGSTNNVQVTNVTDTANDRMAIYKYELTYPRQFNFGNAANFEFTLPASSTSRYIEITNFNNGAVQPVLIDVANGERYAGDIAVAGKIRFVLPPSAERKLVLYNQAGANLTSVGVLQQRTFTNYALANNAADYLIISNALLFNGASGTNPVADYAQYRSSLAGGGYNAKVFDVEELTDQFGWGIKKTPLAIRNFIMYALARFAQKPKHVFLLGKGTVYTDQRNRESDANINRQNLVPTFGNPASDILFAAAPGTAVPLVSIGRLSAVYASEVSDYLVKVKQYEAAQQQASPSAADKEWMKNVAHIIGSGDPNLQNTLETFMSTCKGVISDTLWGANVHTFTKKSGANVEQISDKALERLFEDGISLITYFGHSSTTGLDYNLDNPDAYNNPGKYPLFVALGCSAGNFYNFSSARFTSKDAISEKYVLAPQKGTIGFIASTHFGIVSVLRTWNRQFYDNLAAEEYGKTAGELLASTAAKVIAETINGEDNFYVRVNIEETALHGDPAIKLNVQPKPDFVTTESMVTVDPGFVSVAETSFKLGVQVQNLGKAVSEKIVLSVKREYPDASTQVIVRDTVQAPALTADFVYAVPVDAVRDKGLNKLTVSIDADNSLDEVFEINNSAVKEVFIYEDEARPLYPYNFGIVSNPALKLSVSTANPLIPNRSYQMELDTTEAFNSPLKWSRSLSSTGGLLEATPGIAYQNNTVYYWRVAVVPDTGAYHWNTASFVYIANGDEGFNQSHSYQHFKSATDRMALDSASGRWNYKTVSNDLFIRNAVWGTATGDEGDLIVNVNGASYIRNTCNYGIIINVFDGNSFAPWVNAVANGDGLYGSMAPNCGATRINNFEFNNDTSGRRKAVEFLRMIPNGSYVVVRNQPRNDSARNEYADKWKRDEAVLGTGKSLYAELLKHGFTQIDSLNRPRAFALVYRKNNFNYGTRQVVSEGKYDKILLTALCPSLDDAGTVASPPFGPAKSWKQFSWNGAADGLADRAEAQIIGITPAGGLDTLFRAISPADVTKDVSAIDASKYPYLKLSLSTADTANYTPYQLHHWRLTYDPLPEGAIAPNVLFQIKDTLEIGEPLHFKLAFKNVSTAPFDSLKIKLILTDHNNVAHQLPVMRYKPLAASDTVHVVSVVDTRLYPGKNNLYIYVNADNDQPEQFGFNNFLYRNFYVKEDSTQPIVDVTFDNVHILNRDIIAPKPDILIKLTDESKRLLLNDSSLLSVKVRNLTNNNIRSYAFDNDTLRFNPATNLNDNTASVNFRPYFSEDGEYELMVTGKDKSGNEAGGAEYRVAFQIINKPMISNMLNYPNPFTTSTAFVFTLTGSEIPQNMKIQILTITGKVVREITRQELGPLRIGRNITEFKWDGTDGFGQRLANGVYIYRVVAQLNGKTLDKYRASGDETDQYFNKGYGKMYLMR